MESSPGLIYLEYGANRDGYWNNDKFLLQCRDIIDCIHVLYPGYQVVVEVDWSAGHAKKAEGALNANDMNMTVGGKQTHLRPGTGSTVSEGCLGPSPATLRQRMPDGSIKEIDCKLKPGQTQHFTFKEGDPPPFFDLSAPPEDILDSNNNVLKEGYIGKPKGLKQVLWERGLWEDGLDVDRARPKLAASEDFVNEKSILEEMVHSTGDLLLMSPKGHPELAGKGVEYCWGYSKMYFRKHNDCQYKNLRANTVKATSQDMLPIDRVRRFARKAREYRNAYLFSTNHVDVEKFRKKQKAHRCTMWDDYGFLSRELAAADG